MTKPIHWMSAVELVSTYKTGKLSPVMVAEHLLARIEKHNPTLNCFCLIDKDTTLSQAKQSAERWKKGEPLSPLDGVPISIKDLILTKGWPTLRGSLTVDKAGPWTEDAPAVARCREAGMVFLGKVTSPEFGWKATTDNPLTGITRNPWNINKTPGGSSGGSSSAVAAGLGPLSLGSDGGGSIRIPASMTGTFGLKPSFGRVPAYPPSHTGTLAHYGPMSRDVTDSALLMSIITKPDSRDWEALPADNADYLRNLEKGIAGKRIAYSPRLGYETKVWREVEERVAQAVDKLESLGAHVEKIEGEIFPESMQSFLTLFWSGALHMLDGLPEQEWSKLEPTLQEVLGQCRDIKLSDYLDALEVRNRVGVDFRRFMDNYDFLVTPTIATPPFDASLLTAVDEEGNEWLEWTPFTSPFNMTRNPAVSVPCGFTSDNLPIGMQIVGDMYADADVLQVARAYESAEPLLERYPPDFQ